MISIFFGKRDDQIELDFEKFQTSEIIESLVRFICIVRTLNNRKKSKYLIVGIVRQLTSNAIHNSIQKLYAAILQFVSLHPLKYRRRRQAVWLRHGDFFKKKVPYNLFMRNLNFKSPSRISFLPWDIPAHF